MKLTEEKNAILEKYMEGILAWNEKVNLTNITDPAEFRIKHNADSLMCVDFPEFLEAETVIDVGTGGGFPGIPLAVYAPEKQFILLDSLNKRLKIIDELAGELGIKNITLVHGRAEDAARAKEHREKYDLCVSRAVSNLATLSEYCLPFIKVGGYLLAYKGPGAEEEVKEAAKALKILGGSLVD
ncbi:MAG: 16S rRNA (guanine(527)-N(7))-methyltransferase RsmG, partial [Firmicutes bacterium]|nr:16S rRNA (guanine(527)-N(7))-methyltransferase RsmG [Bacillota bacterium]